MSKEITNIPKNIKEFIKIHLFRKHNEEKEAENKRDRTYVELKGSKFEIFFLVF